MTNISSSWNCLAPFFFAQSNFTSAFWAITTQALFLRFPFQAGPCDLTAIPHMWVVSLGSVTTCPHCFAALFSCLFRMYYKVQLCVDFSVKCCLYITSRRWYCGVTKRWYRGTGLPPLLCATIRCLFIFVLSLIKGWRSYCVGIAVPGSLHCFLWLKPLIVRSYRRPTSILETIFLLLIIISIKSSEWY